MAKSKKIALLNADTPRDVICMDVGALIYLRDAVDADYPAVKPGKGVFPAVHGNVLDDTKAESHARYTKLRDAIQEAGFEVTLIRNLVPRITTVTGEPALSHWVKAKTPKPAAGGAASADDATTGTVIAADVTPDVETESVESDGYDFSELDNAALAAECKEWEVAMPKRWTKAARAKAELALGVAYDAYEN